MHMLTKDENMINRPTCLNRMYRNSWSNELQRRIIKEAKNERYAMRGEGYQVATKMRP